MRRSPSKINEVHFAALLAVALASLAGSSAMALDRGIGVYFDEGASSCCMQDVSAYPVQLTAYLILERPLVTGGISAWEGRLDVDENLAVLSISFMRDAINVGTSPEIMVGFATPIEPDSLVVLATIEVLALGPGAFYFGPLEHPSQSGGNAPAYVDSDNPGVAIAMAYSYGGPGQPIAVVGAMDCPSRNIEDGGEGEGDGDLPELRASIAVGKVVTMMLAPGSVTLTEDRMSARVSEASIPNSGIRTILEGRHASAIIKAHPEFDSERLVRVNKYGETVRLIDMSNIFQVFVESAEDAEALVADLRDVAAVSWAYVPGNFISHSVAVSDPKYVTGNQWGLRNTGWRGGSPGFDIDANGAWDFTVGSSAVKIGIVDGPVDETHPDLSGRVANATGNGGNPHSTATASVAAASKNGQGMVGVDWNCTIVNLTDEISETNNDLIENINTAIDLNVDVLIHSYSTLIGFINPQPGIAPDHEIACANAYNMGILNVCSAGNENSDVVNYPAGFNDIAYAVGGVNRFGTRWIADASHGSSFGNHLDIMAPAESLVIASGSGWETDAAGTSYAAPFVAGVASLLLAEYPGDWIFPELFPDDLMQIMNWTARDLGGPPYYGHGLLQAGSAIEALKLPNKLTHGSIEMAPEIRTVC